MKILLTAINAKYIHSNLAVYNLQAYAMKYQNPSVPLDIEIGEYTINNRVDDILESIYKRKPDILCFSCYIWNISYVTELIREFHKLRPEVPIWVGGPEVSYEAESFLQEYPEVTGAMLGEGEQTFLELCEAYAQTENTQAETAGGETAREETVRAEIVGAKTVGEETAGAKIAAGKTKDGLEKIPGLAYRNKTEIHFTEARKPIDMSSIPFCYGHIEDFENRIIYYESSRGCPFRCSYCLSSVDKQLRFRDLTLVKKELAFFIEKEVPQVKFVDRTFNCKHEHAMEIWRFIKEHDNGITNFHFEISADLLTEEELELLSSMRPGLVQLEIGVQSTNEATITEIHRTMKLDRLKETVRAIQKGGNIHEHLDLIAGLPYEDYDTFAKSFDEIYALKPNQLQLGFLKVLKGSYMYEHRKEYGIVYRDTAPYEVMRTNWLDFSDILRIRQVEEMLEVYYNSGQYEVTMKLLETQFESPFVMYQKFGEYYEEMGYFAMSHSRIRRAEILLEFAEKTLTARNNSVQKASMEERAEREPQQIVEALKESLLYDLYYRENMKSRPAWADDVSEWKAVTKQYCKNGKQSHVERFHYRFPEKEMRSIEKLPDREEVPCYVLFDYTRRNPLDHQAAWQYVEAEIN